jgi:RNA polymerase sigma-70 factor (ECF subfamily)
VIDVVAMIERWMGGDERAAEALYNHFRDRMFRLAYGLLGDPAEAEDVAQDALTYALLNIQRYDAARASFGTWLHIITVSRSRDRLRRRRLRQLLPSTWLAQGRDVAAPGSGPEARAIQSEEKSQVWTAVQDLKPALKEAVLLRYWAGHTYREMADIMGVPLRTAQSRVRLAFQRLQVALGEEVLRGLDEEEAV